MATVTLLEVFPYLILSFMVFQNASTSEIEDNVVKSANMSQTFKYFGFGSNLLKQRIHINNPTAKRYDIGVLDDYRLDFFFWSQRWKGYVATIIPDPGSKVWGAIWDIDVENMDSLDHQEGVKDNIYLPIEVSVKTPKGEVVKCRSYRLVEQPEEQKKSGIPNFLPSKVYLDTIIRGAKESELPKDYIDKLEALPHNGYEGVVLYHQN